MSDDSMYTQDHSYFCIDYAQEDRAHSDAESMGEKDFHEYNPFCDQAMKTVGHTRYAVKVSCQGSESVLGIVRRLLLNDPSYPMTLMPHDISREV